MKLLLLLSLVGVSICSGKVYSIAEEDEAFVKAENSGKAVAYVIW